MLSTKLFEKVVGTFILINLILSRTKKRWQVTEKSQSNKRQGKVASDRESDKWKVKVTSYKERWQVTWKSDKWQRKVTSKSDKWQGKVTKKSKNDKWQEKLQVTKKSDKWQGKVTRKEKWQMKSKSDKWQGKVTGRHAWQTCPRQEGRAALVRLNACLLAEKQRYYLYYSNQTVQWRKAAKLHSVNQITVNFVCVAIESNTYK